MMRASLLIVASLATLAPAAARARGRGCVEQSEVRAVGLSTCSRYGSWDTQRYSRIGFDALELSLATGFHAMMLSGRPLSICQAHGKACDALQPLADGALGRWAFAGTAIMRFSLLRLGPVRLGLHMEMGGNGSTGKPVHSDQLLIRQSSLQYLAGGIYLRGGFALGPFALQLDTLFGGSGVTFFVDNLTDDRALRVSDSRWLITPRLSLQYFFRPDVALELFGGGDVLHHDEVHAGLGLTFYFGRSYDGLYNLAQ